MTMDEFDREYKDKIPLHPNQEGFDIFDALLNFYKWENTDEEYQNYCQQIDSKRMMEEDDKREKGLT